MGRGRARIRGRDRELAELRTALAAETGCLVVVRGPAGIGRSAVLDAMPRELRSDGVRVLRLRLGTDEDRQDEDAFGIAPLVRAVRAEFEAFGDLRLADSLSATVRLRDWAVRHGNGWAPQMVAEFRLLFDRIADRGRTAILLDDAHLLAQPAPLLAAARRSGCQVLVSCRDDTDPTTGLVELLSVADRVLALGPLADEDIARLVRQAAGAKLDGAVLDGLRAALGPLFNNPASALDTLADLRAQGGLVSVHNWLCLTVPPSRIGLPAGHHLLRRAESLGELGPRLLFAVAVLDEVTVDGLPMVAAALGAPVADCGRALDALVDGGVLVVDPDNRVRCHCPALAVSAAGLGDDEAAVRLHASIVEQLLDMRQRGAWVTPAVLANHIAGSRTAVPIDADVSAWLLDLADAVGADAPEPAARWCAAALRHLPPTGPDYAGAVRSLISLVMRTGQYELLAEPLTRFARSGGPPGSMADMTAAAGLVALHTGEIPVDKVVRGLLDRAFVQDGTVAFADWWYGRPLASGPRSPQPNEPIPPIRLPEPISAEQLELLRASLTCGPQASGRAWQRAGRGSLSPELNRLRDAGAVVDVGAVLRIAFDAGYHLPRNGVLGAYHRVVRDYANADWSAAMSAARELELTGCRDTLVHHAARLFAAEICCSRGQSTQAREWLAAAAPLRRLAALRASVEMGLFEAVNQPAEAVRLARRVCAELGDAAPRTGLDRLLIRALRIATSSDETDGVAVLLEEIERLHRGGPWGNTMEIVFMGRGLAHGDVAYLRVAAELVRVRGNRPALLEACLVLGRFAGDPRPWLLEAREIARQCGASAALDRVRALTRERGVSSPRSRGQRDGLHATERRIIELIQDGLTNRQIALELGVTEKTVENRLTRLFARTGYRSRVKLAAASLEGRLGRAAS